MNTANVIRYEHRATPLRTVVKMTSTVGQVSVTAVGEFPTQEMRQYKGADRWRQIRYTLRHMRLALRHKLAGEERKQMAKENRA